MLVGAGAHAQPTQESEELKAQLEQALKVIRELQSRVNALERQRAATPGAPAASGVSVPRPAVEGAPVVGPDSVAGRGAEDSGKARLEISGKVRLDIIYDFDRMNPDWNSALQLSQIPVTCPGDAGCGTKGTTILSVRQSSIDFKGFVPTVVGQLKTDLSFDLFATGGGNTRVRLVNAWAEVGNWGAGQYYSNFMNADTFPNVVDFRGPSGMVFVRNPQVRYTTSVAGDGVKVAIAPEAPNAAIDTGKVSEVDPSLCVTGKTRWPDLTGRFVAAGDWGKFQAAGLLRSVGYQTTTTASGDPSGSKVGWGINFNGWLKRMGKDRFTGQIGYGRGIASYVNDGGVDLAPGANLQAEVVPSLGGFLYYEHYWSDSFSSSLGYSAQAAEHRRAARQRIPPGQRRVGEPAVVPGEEHSYWCRVPVGQARAEERRVAGGCPRAVLDAVPVLTQIAWLIGSTRVRRRDHVSFWTCPNQADTSAKRASKESMHAVQGALAISVGASRHGRAKRRWRAAAPSSRRTP